MFKEGLIKGVFVFFLGVFVGSFGARHFRPGNVPSEAELLMRLAQAQREKAAFVAEFQEVLNGPIQLSQTTTDKNVSIENNKIALNKITIILDEYLNIRSPRDQEKGLTPDNMEGYQKYGADGKTKEEPKKK